ncbi:MAG: transposase, partial [Segetibacter sp.]
MIGKIIKKLLHLNRNSFSSGKLSFSILAFLGKKKKMTLPAEEFLRRYEQHILPPRFCKIRHYGLPGQLQTKERVN